MVKRGKAASKNRKPSSAKQKKGSQNSHSSLKPVTRAQIRNNKSLVAKLCTDLGKKRVAVVDVGNTNDDLEVENDIIDRSPMMLSPVKFEFGSGDGPIDIFKQNSLQKSPMTPCFLEFESESRLESLPMDLLNCLQKTPKTPRFLEFGSESRLESLPMDLLVKILCNLHHDQLRPVFHVSEKIRKAVIQARQWYFNYTTPDRARQEMLRTMTPLPTDRWPFVGKGDEVMRIPSPSTPKAPRPGPRPPSRFKLYESSKLQLFSPKSVHSNQGALCHLLQQTLYSNPWGPNRVLFYEDELCQAVVQNKLR